MATTDEVKDGWDDEDGDWGEFIEEGNDLTFTIVEDPPASAMSQLSLGGDPDALPASPPSLTRQRSYTVMGKFQITQQQKDMIDDVCAVLGLSVGRVIKLLRHFKWDQDALLRDYTTDPVKTLESAGIKGAAAVLLRTPSLVRTKSMEEREAKQEVDCQLCYCPITMDATFALDCGHRYCMDCWKQWCESKFEDGAECLFARCMGVDCPELLPPGFLQANLDGEKREKVADWSNSQFMSGNPYVKWCPRNGCDKAVQYKKAGPRTVTCDCGFKFCFSCRNEAHEPAPCKVVDEWAKKDNSLILWMREQKAKKDNLGRDLVKQCVNCHEIIEKNQGCKHMTCRNCKFEFCWLCYQPWHGHQETLCNNYDDKDRDFEEKEAKGDSSSAGLRRYQFYYTRFENHQKAIKFAERIIADTEKKMNKMQDLEGVNLQQVQFLLDAVLEVIECRRLLQWSYAWAHAMDEGTTIRAQFKMHQDMLEEMTEELHGMTEQPLSKMLQPKQRTSIINHTRVIDKFRQNIIDFSKANH